MAFFCYPIDRLSVRFFLLPQKRFKAVHTIPEAPPADSICGYLLVLNHQPVLDRLQPEEQLIAAKSMMGCLFRVEAILESEDLPEPEMRQQALTLLRHRESLNCQREYLDPELRKASEELSEMLLRLLRSL